MTSATTKTEATESRKCTPEALILARLPGIGPRLHRSLVARFGSAEAALKAPIAALEEIPGISRRLAEIVAQGLRDVDVSEELRRCEEEEIEILTSDLPSYPARLLEIYDPPPVLYAAGELLPRDALALAIVGTRHATLYGLQQAQRLSAGLARAGFTIVSGLARGIDAAAHRGALEAGGRTIAVLAGGVRDIYPPEHKELAAEIAFSGALISETGLRARPARGLFPRRNRIISGLSLGLIVVEAGMRSGALTSARHAMEQNREVMAVPGRVDSRMSHGCHTLLRDGAVLVESVDDVIEALGPLAETARLSPDATIRHPAELQLNAQEALVLQAIDMDPTLIDQVAITTGLPISRVLSTLSALEMRRLIRRLSGQYVVRA